MVTLLVITYDVGVQKPGDSCQGHACDGTTDLRGPDDFYEWCQVLHWIHSRPICSQSHCDAYQQGLGSRRDGCTEDNQARYSKGCAVLTTTLSHLSIGKHVSAGA